MSKRFRCMPFLLPSLMDLSGSIQIQEDELKGIEVEEQMRLLISRHRAQSYT